MRQVQRLLAGQGIADRLNHVDAIDHRWRLPAGDHLQVDLNHIALSNQAGLPAGPQSDRGGVG